jgi:hypothetical protein
MTELKSLRELEREMYKIENPNKFTPSDLELLKEYIEPQCEANEMWLNIFKKEGVYCGLCLIYGSIYYGRLAESLEFRIRQLDPKLKDTVNEHPRADDSDYFRTIPPATIIKWLKAARKDAKKLFKTGNRRCWYCNNINDSVDEAFDWNGRQIVVCSKCFKYHKFRRYKWRDPFDENFIPPEENSGS